VVVATALEAAVSGSVHLAAPRAISAAAAQSMRWALLRHGCAVLLMLSAWPALSATQVLVISGLGGEAEYAQRFEDWSANIAQHAATVEGSAGVTRLAGAAVSAQSIEAAIRSTAAKLKAGDSFVLVLLGHGSFDGNDYRFNIPGPDVTGAQLATWLNRIPASIPQLIVNATSTSGAVAEQWAKPNRIIITATQSGGERNATKFGGFWAEALGNAEADLDKDGIITAQEAYDFANRRVADAFKADASIVTEHARIVGKEAARFIVARLGGAAQFASDDELIALRAQQRQFEEQLGALRVQKSELTEDDFYARIEPVLVDMARLGVRIDARLVMLNGGAANSGASGERSSDAPR
jgi:hypothetical protein